MPLPKLPNTTIPTSSPPPLPSPTTLGVTPPKASPAQAVQPRMLCSRA